MRISGPPARHSCLDGPDQVIVEILLIDLCFGMQRMQTTRRFQGGLKLPPCLIQSERTQGQGSQIDLRIGQLQHGLVGTGHTVYPLLGDLPVTTPVPQYIGSAPLSQGQLPLPERQLRALAKHGLAVWRLQLRLPEPALR